MKQEEEQIQPIQVSEGASIPDPRDKRIITAWSISLVGTITAIILLCSLKPTPYLDIVKFFPTGIKYTFMLTIAGIAMALPIGCIVGLGRLSRNRGINLLASTYVEVIRGIPLMVQLCFIYYGLGNFVALPDMLAASLAMAICYGAYMGEVFRAGISAVNKGQTEAARSLGFNRFQTMTLVVMPQAWRTILPPIGNEFIALVKDTSLVSIMAMGNILHSGRDYLSSRPTMVFEAYTMVALMFLCITLILSKLVSIMEARLNYYDHK